MNGQVKIFLSYSHKDKMHRDLFLTHFSSLLKTENISIWTDLEINPGTIWDNEIKQKLSESDIILFLISANFISSEYINQYELSRAYELHEINRLSIIPILLSNCSLKGMRLEEIQSLPTDPRFIEVWSNKNDAWVNVIEGIRKSIKKIIEDLRIWDPVSAKDYIIELLKQPEKLEDACNKTIDFAVNYSTIIERELEAVNLKRKYSVIEYLIEKNEKDGKRTNFTLKEIFDEESALRLEIYKLIISIMSDLSKN